MKLSFATLVLLLVPFAAHATDYNFDDGAVQFSAPDAWTPLMEKHDGDPQFLALQVPGTGADGTLARITVTTQHVADAAGYGQFMDDQIGKSRRLPGYSGSGVADNSQVHRYVALENGQKNTYAEFYDYRDGLALQVRCIRPAAAEAAWAATFDAGCAAIAKSVIKR